MEVTRVPPGRPSRTRATGWEPLVKYNTIFYKNGVILHAYVYERRRDFIQGGTSGFFQKFSREAKSDEICFCTTKN